MRKQFLWIYNAISWSIIAILFLAVLLFNFINNPSIFLEILQKPLSQYGINYGSMSGRLLTGFTLTNLNYNNQVKAKEITLKVDFKQLKRRVLYIDNIVLDSVEIDKKFLTSLIDTNSSKNSSSTGAELPFDKIIVNSGKISLNSIDYKNYHLEHLKLNINDVESDMDRHHKGRLSLSVKSNVATGDIKGKFDDGDYYITSTLEGDKSFLNGFLKEQNATLLKNPKVVIRLDGDMKKINYDLTIHHLNIKQNEYLLQSKKLHTFGKYGIESSDVVNNIDSKLSSNVGELDLKSWEKLNINDINNSLKFTIKTNLNLYDSYVNNFLKESNVTIIGKTPISLEAQGDLNSITMNLLATTKLFGEGITSLVKIESNGVKIELKKHQIKGQIALTSDAKNIAINLKSKIEGDYMKPLNIKSKSHLVISKFNAFGVNLTQLTPLNLNIFNGVDGLKVSLNSKKIELYANSRDLDTIKFSLMTQKIYPSKIVKLEKELKDKFIKLNLKGTTTISKQQFNILGKVASNRGFAINIDAKNIKNRLDAKLFTKSCKLTAKGNLKSKKVDATLDIHSLKALQQELTLLYPFEMVDVDGELYLKAKLKGEKLFAEVVSPKLKFKEFNIEKLNIDGEYEKELLTLNRLSFNTTRFKQSSLNKHFYLKKKGFISLGAKRDILIDMYPNISIKGEGNKGNMKATLAIEKLPLGYPEYGEVLFSCDIDYSQQGEKKKIVGGVFLDKLKLFYESKYLDPSNDNDVIVLTKKDKQNRAKKESFLNNTYIDLSIFAPNANYQTRDIKLKFTVNLKAKKRFGKRVRMLGKIEDIRGRVEQAPKIFTVVDSNIVFRGTKEINPLLDLQVDYELPEILITIKIHGNAKHPKLIFSSNPPLPKKDILSYLLLGVSTANLAEGKGSLGREAQLFIMNQAARDFAYEVDLDRVFIKDDGTGEGYAVQVGKKIDDKTMGIIETSKEGNSFILEYEVNKNINIKVGHHQKTIPSQSIDLYFRKRFH